MRRDAGLLGLTTIGARPPERARVRLLAAIAREPRVSPVRIRKRWWVWAPSLAAAGLAMLFVFAWQANRQLEQQIEELRNTAQQDRAALARTRETLALFTEPGTVQVTLTAAPAKPLPHGKAIYNHAKGRLVFVASNLNPLPPDKTYELWVVPASGTSPIPAGIFKPNARGNAAVIDPPLPAGVEAKAFAVTIEREGGATVPTKPLVLVGSG